jgi:hypothetical protein
MTLTLRDRVFETKQGELVAGIRDPYWSKKYDKNKPVFLSWELEFGTKGTVYDDERWTPGVYHHNLRFNVRRWTDILGEVVEWNTPYDVATGERHGGFYVFEYENISRAKLCFVERDGFNFHVKWDGFCNVYSGDDAYGADVPFSLDAWATFTRIRVNGSEFDTNESLWGRLAKFVDPEDYILHSTEERFGPYNSGVWARSAVFTPRGG